MIRYLNSEQVKVNQKCRRTVFKQNSSAFRILAKARRTISNHTKQNMDKSKPDQTLLQLIIAFILTLFASAYSLTLLTYALSAAGSINVLLLTLASAVLIAI